MNKALPSFTFNELPDFMDFMVKRVSQLEDMISKQLACKPSIQDEPRMSMAETAKYLNCSLSTLQSFKNNNLIPFHQLGRHVYFIASEIDEASLIPAVDYNKK